MLVLEAYNLDPLVLLPRLVVAVVVHILPLVTQVLPLSHVDAFQRLVLANQDLDRRLVVAPA